MPRSATPAIYVYINFLCTRIAIGVPPRAPGHARLIRNVSSPRQHGAGGWMVTWKAEWERRESAEAPAPDGCVRGLGRRGAHKAGAGLLEPLGGQPADLGTAIFDMGGEQRHGAGAIGGFQ